MAHLREPRLTTLPPQKVLLVTAPGDPNTHVGPCSAEEPTVARLELFIAERGYEIAGAHEEEYLRGPGMLFAGDPGSYLTLIRYTVRRRAAL